MVMKKKTTKRRVTKKRVVKRKATKKRVVKRKAIKKRVVKRKATKKKTKFSRPKVIKRTNRQTGKTHKKPDSKRTALPPGKRRSKNGNIYTETRKNRSDRNKKTKL